ncbi:hypothetical protein CONLIGDRAFT_244063 [Coniochaeta ligniaria NRRL 30616]|uniref:Tafazzin n=1 Tax=Coniochaeta ligniaria NRRL 30616 TaxID=1408157 RepID=A0A1J7JR73_9PEZI|nr:hypothetical protein CONLIGDRAFT_244063 [Coniochaeta ligniaria NRRL 30616]
MPKKRQQFKQYSKPQSTAPASLSSGSTTPRASNHDDQPGRSVNELLADLRRVSLRSQQVPENSSAFAAPGAPTVPPAIRRILRLPETPAPPPRRPVRIAPNGRRLPPGPAAPRSWLSQSRYAPKSGSGAHVSDSFERRALPGAYAPSRRSLVDITLRRIAEDWEFQRSYNRHYLYSLPNHLKVALITYLGMCHGNGVSVADLRAILQPYVDDNTDDEVEEHDPSTANEDILHLDLTGSLGRDLKLRELSDLLFRPASTKSPYRTQSELQDSWDTPASQPSNPSIPRPLLPNITHLSLAIDPKHAAAVSWRHLLSFATRFPTLTHLSLAYWPEPTLTPNAKLASFVVPTGTGGSSRTLRYGGTGPYSHSLDDDWSEAVLVLRRLSKSLYGLEWLDLTGCVGWATALMAVAEHDFVDWAGDWGKIGTVLLYPGYKPGLDAGVSETEQFEKDVGLAAKLERYIRGRRAGRGRPIDVETDAVGGWNLGVGIA